jgi:DUF4097 and DUF4098 domain-containing protein YvlB
MPVFATPEPIAVTVELGAAAVRIVASDRPDTHVDVSPSDPADESDRKAADQVRVDLANGTLTVAGPKVRALDFSKRSRSVDVTIELPSGSSIAADLQAGDISGTGSLGETRLASSIGNVRLDRTGPLRVRATGHITVGAVDGDATVSTGSGTVRIGAVGGAAEVKNSNGDTTLDAVAGNVRVRSANGAIRVARAGANVDVKTSNGAINLSEITNGEVVLETALGDLEIGIAEGTAAWLEVNTGFGHVLNRLENATRPDEADRTVEVRGHTGYGDITIRRSEDA